MRERPRRTLELRERNRREAWARRTHDSIVRAVSSAVSDFERLAPNIDGSSDSALAVVDEIEGSVRDGLDRLRLALQRLLSEQDESVHAGEVAGAPPDLPPADLPPADLPPADLPRANLPRPSAPRADLPRADLTRGPAPDAALGGRLNSLTSGSSSVPSESGQLEGRPPLVPGRLNRVGQRAQEGVRRRVSMVVAMPPGADDAPTGDLGSSDTPAAQGLAPSESEAGGGNEILARLLAYCDDEPAAPAEPVADDHSASDRVPGTPEGPVEEAMDSHVEGPAEGPREGPREEAAGPPPAEVPPAEVPPAEVTPAEVTADVPPATAPGPDAPVPEGAAPTGPTVATPEPPASEVAPPAPTAEAPAQPGSVPDPDGGPPEGGQPAAESPLVTVARALADTDESVRSLAAGGLASFEPAMVEEWVIASMRSADLPDAVLAARVVRALRMTPAAGEVLDRAARTEPDSRAPLLDALASLPLQPGDLLALLAFVRPAHRQEAARVCAELRGVDLVSYLESLAADPSSRTMPAVSDLLGHAQEPAIGQVAPDPIGPVETTPVGTRPVEARPVEEPHVSRLMWRALREGSPAQRDTVLALFAQLRPESGSQLLASLGLAHSGDDAPSDRLLALQLAVRGGGPAAGQVVIDGLRDADADVRAEAAAQLVALGNADATAAVRAVLSDHDATVRRRAVEALPASADLVPALLFALKDPDVDVRRTTESLLERCPGAADALAGALVDPELGPAAERLLVAWGAAAVPVLENRLLEGNAVGAAAARLLVAREGTGRFAAGLSSLDADDRLRAVEVIGATGGPEAVDPLADRLTDPDHRVRARAVRHLGRLGDVRTLPEIVRVSLTDPVAAVAAAAGEALAALESSTGTASSDEEPAPDQPQKAPGPDYGPPGVPDPDLPGSDDVEPEGPPTDRQYEDPS